MIDRRSVLLGCASIALTGSVVSARPAGAQAEISGAVRIIERDGPLIRDLGNAVVYLEAVGTPPFAGASRDTEVVNMKNREFMPHVQIVRAGGAVAYPNKDPFSHNVFSNTALGAFDLGLYRTGFSRAASFKRPGVYAVYCNIHARMVSMVIAVPTPYVTRANANGAFALHGVPPGTYRLHVWHERAPEVQQTVAVSSAGISGITATLDARNYLPAPHLDKFGNPYASTRADRY